MKEDFLHYLWRFQKFDDSSLTTDNAEAIKVVNPGIPNHGGGPDFLHAKVWIGETLWAGAVELHIKASSWYHHHHHMDKNYDSVILHVVWESDVEVCYPSGRIIPCLVLSSRIHPQLLKQYDKQFKKNHSWIPCEKLFSSFPQIKWQIWKERLYLERLERKTLLIHNLLKANNNDWEGTLFQLLAKNFGLNRNGNFFLKWAQHIPFSVLRKNFSDPQRLEALFFGMSGLLEGDLNNPYKKKLKSDFDYLKQKFQFTQIPGFKVEFSRLRPPNFPTIRLSQLAQFYHLNQRPFSSLIAANHLKDLHWILKVGVSDFWKTHFTFDKEGKSTPKKLSKSFFDLLVINTLIPMRFAYSQKQGWVEDKLVLRWIDEIKTEQNHYTEGFSKLGTQATSALDSQAMIQLKQNYCDKKNCLKCALGFHFIKISP